MRVIGLVVILALVTFVGSASAEKVKTNQEAKLLNHPGERGQVIMKIKEGQNMTVLSKEGRWLKVRVSGRTGYVPRSKVDMASEDDLVRNTRRRPFVDGRGTHRTFSSQEGPDDRVGADATGDPASSGGDDDEDKPKKASKKGGDDDEDKPKKGAKKGGDDDEDKPKKASKKGGDDDEDKPKKGAKKGGDDDDEDKPKKGGGKKGGDDDVVATDDDDSKATESAPEAEVARPKAHVSEKTKILSERDKDSEVEFVAKPTDALYPAESKGKWTRVETEEGDTGWVLTSDLQMEDGGGGGGTHKRVIDLKAGLGVTFIQQGMRTQGSTITGTDQVPDQYNIGTSALTLSLDALALFPKSKYLVGGELLFDATKTVAGGVNYKSTTTGLTITDFNLRLVGAYPTQRKSGLMILARLGFRYRGYLVDNYNDVMKNPAKIPQETLKAPTLGAALVLPKLTEKIGLSVGVDAILFGSSISQTAGLEDGASPSMTGARVEVGVIYHWRKDMDLQGKYDLDYAGYDFGTPNTGSAMQSTRGHTGTDVTRTDILHTVSFGIAKGF